MSKIVKRIQKLLALADGSSGNEAEQALKLARRLMTEHAISQADLAKNTDDSAFVRKPFVFVGNVLTPNLDHAKYSRQRTQQWRRSLANIIALYLDLYGTFTPGSNVFSFYGPEEDCDLAAYLYSVAAEQIDWGAKEYMRNTPRHLRRHGKTAGTEFRQSAVAGLHSKLESMKAEDKADHADSYALVVSKRDAISDWVNENFSVKKSKVRVARYSSEGYAAGQRVKLHKGVSGSSTRYNQLT